MKLIPQWKKRRKKSKKERKTKIITKVIECESFFNFFKSYDSKSKGKKTTEEEDDDEDEQANEGEILDEELELGNFLRDELVPYAVEYYLGLAGGDDFDGEMEEEEEDDEEEDVK